MDKILQQLLSLVEKGNVEHRCAALLVLGALKLDNGQVLKTAAAMLEQVNPVLKDYALRFFEEIQPKAAAPLLIRCLDDSDKEVQERVVRLLSRSGQAVVDPLLRHAPTLSRPGQINAARILCAVRGKEAFKGILQMLVSGTDEFNKTICDLMTPAIRELDGKEQESLYAEVEAFAATLNPTQQRPAVISSMRLLGQLGRPQARRWLFKFLAPDQHFALRSHALVALLRCLRDQDLRKDEYARLFPLLEEAEFSEITRLALDLLDAHSLPDDSRPLLSGLLESSHSAVQQFALRKMADFSSPATVRTLIEQLGDADYRRRDIAALSLHKIPESRTALIKELLVCDNPSKASTIAELLPTYEGKWRQDTLEALWKRLQTAIVGEDRIQTSFLYLLKAVGTDYVYEQLVAQGIKLSKGRKYKEAIAFLTPLKDFPEFKPEHKFQLALAQLKLHSHGVTSGSHRQDPAIDLLTDLYRNSAYPVFETLKKEKNLEPEDLFYLGFNIVERHGDERSLGKELLEHIVQRFPRNKIGKNAKNKLRLLSW